MVIQPGTSQTANQAWTCIERLFRDKIQTRALQLKAEFKDLVLHDMSIAIYY